ncbi:hypothetical protein GUJ93_ZPchr0008g12615 [Zizania palustris]|uniref:Uncharacterized protein n=1 Tax=Zizania palustris TaxID=103762 RepID=A0A8J5RL00_ZIZPA|nr:hypothetical protein GUJ93_ZPchr0008g12615 [Zizania palustris]
MVLEAAAWHLVSSAIIVAFLAITTMPVVDVSTIAALYDSLALCSSAPRITRCLLIIGDPSTLTLVVFEGLLIPLSLIPFHFERGSDGLPSPRVGH